MQTYLDPSLAMPIQRVARRHPQICPLSCLRRSIKSARRVNDQRGGRCVQVGYTVCTSGLGKRQRWRMCSDEGSRRTPFKVNQSMSCGWVGVLRVC